MTALRSLVVHVDGSPRSAARLVLARQLAAAHGAVLEAVLAAAPSLAELPLAYSAGSEAVSVMLELDTERRRRARLTFDTEAARPGPPMHWIELDQELTLHGFVQRALYADLLVLGQHDAADPLAWGVAPDFVPSVLAASGKPALVLPHTGRYAGVGRNVLIAWKPSREAASALAGALPLLREARQIHVAANGPEGTGGRAGLGPLEAYLQRHGVHASVAVHGSDDEGIGERLLSIAADVEADLLVMGCYGHGRTREWLLGGASRTLLQSMTLPVLMAH